MNESNIGQTIKSVVSILCVIGIIACVIAGFALISQDLEMCIRDRWRRAALRCRGSGSKCPRCA